MVPGNEINTSQIINARVTVAAKPKAQFVPISFSRSSPLAPDRNLIMAVRVNPNRNISKKLPAAMYNTHSPKTSGAKYLARMTKLKNPMTAEPILFDKDKKLSLFSALVKLDLTFVVLVNSYLDPKSKRISNGIFELSSE